MNMKKIMNINWQPSPILIKEMRSTMRSKRTFTAMTLFLLLLVGLQLFIYYTVTQNSVGSSSDVGQMLFGFSSAIELLLLATITPPLTATAISNEHQQKTFDMLISTPLTPAQILRGKLLASMNYLFLLIFASLPISSVVFLFGGVTPSALLWWLALTITLLLMLGTLGLFISTILRNGGAATALTYIICMLMFVVLPLGIVMMITIMNNSNQFSNCLAMSIWVIHPAGSLASIVINETEYNALAILPATLPLYGALAALFFLAAEARLSELTQTRWSRLLLIIGLLLVVIAAIVYIVAVPVQNMC